MHQSWFRSSSSSVRSRARRAEERRRSRPGRSTTSVRSGSSAREDACRQREIGGDTGNIVVDVPPTDASEQSASFSAHTSTRCSPKTRSVPVIEGGVVRNQANTILGADNKAAIAVMLDAVRTMLRPRAVRHAGIELIFTPREETGCDGRQGLRPWDDRRAKQRLRVRPRGADRRHRPGSPVSDHAGRHVFSGPVRPTPASRPKRDARRSSPRQRHVVRASTGANRRGDDGEHRPDLRRHGAQHRSR